MKYVLAYTIAFTVLLALGVYDQTPALTGEILLGGAHACGMMAACSLWLLEQQISIAAESRWLEASLVEK